MLATLAIKYHFNEIYKRFDIKGKHLYMTQEEVIEKLNKMDTED